MGRIPSIPAQPASWEAWSDASLLSLEHELNSNVYLFKIAVHFKERNIFLIGFRFISFKFNQRKHFWFTKPDFLSQPLPPVTGISQPSAHVPQLVGSRDVPSRMRSCQPCKLGSVQLTDCPLPASSPRKHRDRTLVKQCAPSPSQPTKPHSPELPSAVPRARSRQAPCLSSLLELRDLLTVRDAAQAVPRLSARKWDVYVCSNRY